MALETTVTFTYDADFEHAFMQETSVRTRLLELAAQGTEYAQAASPQRTGRWKRSIRPVVEADGSIGITADPHTWHWYEFGNYHMPPSAPLRAAVEGLGLEFRDKR
jgi:hypothetical protein